MLKMGWAEKELPNIADNLREKLNNEIQVLMVVKLKIRNKKIDVKSILDNSNSPPTLSFTSKIAISKKKEGSHSYFKGYLSYARLINLRDKQIIKLFNLI